MRVTRIRRTVRCVAAVVALTVAVPAGGRATTTPLGKIADDTKIVSKAAGTKSALLRFARSFAKGAPFGDQLLRVATMDAGGRLIAPRPAKISFRAAMTHLLTVAGIDDRGRYELPPPDIAAASAPVVEATAVAGRLAKEAFARLSPADQRFLWAQLGFTGRPKTTNPRDERRAMQLAGLVDMAKMTLGAGILGDAMSDFPRNIRGRGFRTWLGPGGLVEIGSTNDDAYSIDRVLIIDLGGNETYTNHAATYAPGSTLALPVSAILDLGGNDSYAWSGPASPGADHAWAQGVGIGGIGLIADRWGDDTYSTTLANSSVGCQFDPYHFFFGAGTNRQFVYAQGVGVLGVGGIADLSGNDTYTATNTQTLSNQCHWGKAYTFAQAAGVHFGVGALVDDTGDDKYVAYSEEGFQADNMAHTYAQGSAGGGVAALIDKEGHDYYRAEAYAHTTVDPSRELPKGGYAYVHAQGSVWSDREDASGGVVQLPPSLGLHPVPVCGSLSIVLPPVGGANPGCDSAGAAVLVDLVGNDTFLSLPHAELPSTICQWAAFAVSSSQGSAAWSGLAALLAFDLDNVDTFVSSPYATGNCQYLYTRAMSYGQGYGGPILWDPWDPPYPDGYFVATPAASLTTKPFWTPAIGIMATGGIVENDKCIHYVPSGLPIPIVPPGVDVCTDPPLPQPGKSKSFYSSTPVAINQGAGAAIAESWVQGVGGNLADTPNAMLACSPPVFAPYPACSMGPMIFSASTPLASAGGRLGTGVGVGINLDWAGDDTFTSAPSASGPTSGGFFTCPVGVCALTYAQGASLNGIGIQVNVGKNDTYTAIATENGTPVPGKSRPQAYADGSFIVAGNLSICLGGPCTVTTGFALPAVAVQIDLMGKDTYSEAPERPAGCQRNGNTLGTWPLGVGAFDPAIWGTVTTTPPCTTPTPDTGNGDAIGIDWLSDIPL